MQDKPRQETQQPRKPYRKPELKKVPLKPEEAVLGFCKISGHRGPGTSLGCGGPIGCYRKGS